MPRPRYAATHPALIRPAPCDGCVHSQTCAQQGLACAAVSQWVDSGKLPALELVGPRDPTRARWERLYPTRARWERLYGPSGTAGHHQPPKSRLNGFKRLLDAVP